MKKFRYTENFFSLQGEARFTGVPSVFLRLFGCNLRCPKFNSVTSDTINHEVQEVIRSIHKYNSFEELPLVETGCDSYPSVYPEFKHFAHDDESDVLAAKLVKLLPTGRWQDTHLVITGGEPLLPGWQKAYSELMSHDVMTDLKDITFETNGTQTLTEEFKRWSSEWVEDDSAREITFSVSAKLSCSGEPRDKAIKPEIVAEYQQYGHTYLKLVVATEADVNEALEVIQMYRDAGFTGGVYLMPVGGTYESFQLNNKQVAELALKHGLRYSDRLHIGLYGNSWAT